jgi:hypothetical protein
MISLKGDMKKRDFVYMFIYYDNSIDTTLELLILRLGLDCNKHKNRSKTIITQILMFLQEESLINIEEGIDFENLKYNTPFNIYMNEVW